MSLQRSHFDKDGNLFVNNGVFDKCWDEIGRKTMYLVIITARNSPYKTRAKVREVLGISRATEWRWRNELREKGYLPNQQR